MPPDSRPPPVGEKEDDFMILCWDTETDGLLPDLTRIHVISLLADGWPDVKSYQDRKSVV